MRKYSSRAFKEFPRIHSLTDRSLVIMIRLKALPSWVRRTSLDHPTFSTHPWTSATRSFQHQSKLHQVVLTIKAEHPDRLWERRTPLAPNHVEALIQKFGQSLAVRVESSQKRIFDDESYLKAGAELVSSGTAHGDIIIAIKEIPIDHLRTREHHSKTYLFFSHTHKGQAYNLPLLKQMVTCGDQFIDWELLVDPQTGTREVSFGRLAGVAGAAEALSGYGLFALKLGFSTPFLNLARPYTYSSTDELFSGLDRLRSVITREGYRGPIVSVAVTGFTGRVGKGIVETLDQAGIEWMEDLAQLQDQIVQSQKFKKHHRILGYKARLEDYVVHHLAKEQEKFDRTNYNAHPENYSSAFHDCVAPWSTLLVNGAYWSSGFPRLLSNDQLARLLKQPDHRLKGVVDVSCDFQGGLEFVDRATTIEDPYAYFKYNKSTSTVVESKWDDPDASLQLVSIEILPSELARDASEEFSSAILPYLTALIQSKLPEGHIENPELLRRLENGTICGNGRLTPEHEGLSPLLQDFAGHKTLSNSHERIQVDQGVKNVVIFGSGLVAKPAVETLLLEPGIQVTIAAKVVEEAEKLKEQVSAKNPLHQDRIRIVQLDAHNDRAGVARLVKEAQVVMSLLPAAMHPLIASACLEHSTHLVTASYVSPGMAEFDDAAKSKNLIFLNELGLDPGIDHMTAVRLIQRLKRDKPDQQIKSFVSFCGGLPECSDGLLGYRFSWSPRGVLEAAGNPAEYLLGGKKYEISGEKLLKRKFTRVGEAMFDGKFKEGNLALEGVANRDSLGYIPRYGLDPTSLETMLRGTLRFEGFCEVMHVLKKIGLFKKDGYVQWEKDQVPTSWDQVIERMGGKIKEGRVKQVLTSLGLLPELEPSTAGLRDSPKLPDPSELQKIVPIDLLCQFLSHKLQYRPNERDLVLLSHEVRTESAKGEARFFKAELIARGDEDSSAMAKTVGSPVAIGALALLNQGSRIPKGVVRPVEESVWDTVLSRLESECQLEMVEKEYSLTKAQAKIGGGLETVLRSAIKKW